MIELIKDFFRKSSFIFYDRRVSNKPGVDQQRRARDPKDIRALSHPVRLALLEVLAARESATATECAPLVGESPQNCSFHLRTLAKHGFVEAVPQAGKERPWRRIERAVWVDPTEDETGAAAGEAFDEATAIHESARLSQWVTERRLIPQQWRDALLFASRVAWMTPAESARFNRDVEALLAKYDDRLAPRADRPDDAEFVRFFGFSRVVHRDGPQQSDRMQSKE